MFVNGFNFFLLKKNGFITFKVKYVVTGTAFDYENGVDDRSATLATKN